MGRRVRCSELPSGSLDQRAKGDLVRMLLEQVAKQLFKRGPVGWQGVDIDDRAIGIGNTFRARLGSHLRSFIAHRAGPAQARLSDVAGADVAPRNRSRLHSPPPATQR